jgi:hypothetical protein
LDGLSESNSAEADRLLELGAIKRNRNTKIITHGLASEYVINNARFGEEDGFDDLISIYLSYGWNYGIFQWTQIADKPLERFMLAESYIESSSYYANMDYKHVDRKTGQLITSDVVTDESVMEMFVRNYRAHFEHFPVSANHEVRLAGHSLGGHLIISVAHAIAMDDSIKRKPDRVTVLDMVFSNGPKQYFYDLSTCGEDFDIANILGCYVTEAGKKTDTVFVFFRSSSINRCLYSSENYPDLIKKSDNALFVTVRMNGWGDAPIGRCYSSSFFKPYELMDELSKLQVQVREQHIKIVPYVESSLLHTARIITKVGSEYIQTNNLAPSEQMPTSQMRLLAKNKDTKCYTQYDDKNRDVLTGNTMDHDADGDYFMVIPCQNFNI